jgi:integrase
MPFTGTAFDATSADFVRNSTSQGSRCLQLPPHLLHRRLVNGVGIAQVAELMGHGSTEMVMTVYSKLSQQVGHLRDAAKMATGG